MSQDILERLGTQLAKLDEIAEVVRQTQETLERVQERIGQTTSEFIRVGSLSGKPLHIERDTDGSTYLYIGQVGEGISVEMYNRLRALAFGAE